MDRIEALRRRLEKTEVSQAKRLAKAQFREGHLEEQIEAIAHLRTRQKGPLDLVNSITESLPRLPTLWLTVLEEKDRVVSIEGEALSLTSITHFIRTLKRCPVFTRVYLSGWEASDGTLRFRAEAKISYWPMDEQAGRKSGFQRKNRPIIRVIVLSALVSILLHVVSIWPLQTEIDSLERQKQNSESVLSQKEGNSTDLPQSIQSLSRARSRLQPLQLALARRESPAVMAQIQQLARNSDLEIKSFVPLERVRSRFYQEYPFQISLNGSFHNLGRFLEKVGQCEQIINVTNIVIKGVDGDPNPGTTVRVRMTSSTFVMENPGSNPEKEAD